MAIKTSNKTEQHVLQLTCYQNCDDVFLCWRTGQGNKLDVAIPACLGFKIERQRHDVNGNWGPVEVLRNRVGFDPIPPASPEGDLKTEPSSIWPFQRYDWTDHGANNGETVRYRICAMALPAEGEKLGEVVLAEIANSGWTDAIRVEAHAGNGVYAFFNRGAVMSQYVARIARKNGWDAAGIKAHIKDLEEPLRRFLSGELRVAMLKLLDDALGDFDTHVYAALYELSDDELIAKLSLLRGRAHVVLANGSDKAGDGNSTARDTLRNAQVDIHDRLLKSKGLGHNKFLVLAESKGEKPVKVWTGSTNWAATGLCTQLNNGLLANDDGLARHYFNFWSRLKDAASDFTKELVAENAKSPYKSGSIDAWFTRIRNKSKKNIGTAADIQALIDLVNSAQQCILYVMFQPGIEPLQSILSKAGSIYVRGVVSTVTSQANEAFTLKGVGSGTKAYETALIQPDGIKKSFAAWAEEVTREQFLYPPQNPGIGHAITHAKMFVIDPFGPDCRVVTGSHNFSGAASEQNDENFVVIRENRRLAEAYAVACMSTYAHYRWRAYVRDKMAAGEEIWDHLDKNPAWQDGRLTAPQKSHQRIWCP
jgi:phosphatidylserine/phosphatidylglycerophosphate/cardiolipin synthase-like enzyme